MYSQHLASFLAGLGALVAAGFFTGCSTPQTRIAERSAYFQELAPEHQELIREGRIDQGFTEEMVWLALGEPDRVERITGDPNRDQVWEYVEYRDGAAGRPLFTGHYHYWFHDPTYPYFLYYPNRQEYARMRVTFNHNEVVSFSQIES